MHSQHIKFTGDILSLTILANRGRFPNVFVIHKMNGKLSRQVTKISPSPRNTIHKSMILLMENDKTKNAFSFTVVTPPDKLYAHLLEDQQMMHYFDTQNGLVTLKSNVEIRDAPSSPSTSQRQPSPQRQSSSRQSSPQRQSGPKLFVLKQPNGK